MRLTAMAGVSPMIRSSASLRYSPPAPTWALNVVTAVSMASSAVPNAPACTRSPPALTLTPPPLASTTVVATRLTLPAVLRLPSAMPAAAW